MCDVESWSFVYHTKWNISKTKQENKSVKEVTLQFSMIFQIRHCILMGQWDVNLWGGGDLDVIIILTVTLYF
jgi:uncharacterized membrane protein YagU involved in acid resistance